MTLAPVIDPSDKRPGTYLQVTLGVGAASAGDQPRIVRCFGNKTSAGTATVAKKYSITSEDDARTLFGAGSELFLMCKAAFKAFAGATVEAIASTESVGTAATGTLTATGTATADGSIEVSYLGETIAVAIASGTAAAGVATALEAALEAMTDWPLDKSTAMAAAAVCTLTFIHKGTKGNRASLRVVSNTPGITMAGPATGYLTGGATSDDPQAALDATAPERCHYLVPSWDDATQLAKFKTQANTYSGPDHGKRQVVVAASTDTLANATTLATGLNASRVQVGHLEDADDLPSMIAAALAATRARYEAIDPGVNLDDLPLTGIKVPNDSVDWTTAADAKSELNNGLTPLFVRDGTIVIGRSITTRSKDTQGNANYAVLDTTKVTVPDFVADDFAVGVPAEFGAHDGQPAFKAGKDDPEGKPPPEGVLVPKMLKAWLFNRLLGHEAAGILEPGSVEANKAQIVAELASAPAGRFNCSVPLDVIEGAHQFGIDVRQVA